MRNKRYFFELTDKQNEQWQFLCKNYLIHRGRSLPPPDLWKLDRINRFRNNPELYAELYIYENCYEDEKKRIMKLHEEILKIGKDL